MNKLKKMMVTAGLSIGLVAGGATVAQANPGLNWNALAQCESGGNAQINTGNGYHGAYQFDQSTWQANGGGAYAPTANGATLGQQTQVAQNLYAARGDSPWPTCGGELYSGGAQSQPEPVAEPVTEPAPVAIAPEPVAEPIPEIIPETVVVPELEIPENSLIDQTDFEQIRDDVINHYENIAVHVNAQIDRYLD